MALSDYEAPKAAVSSLATEVWASLSQLWRRSPDQAELPLMREAELRTLEQVRLSHVVQAIDWRGAVDALDLALANSGGGAAAMGTRVLVCPPHAGHADIVTLWGERHAARRIDAPPAADLLAAAADTAGQAGGKGGGPAALPAELWVLPRLEHCFLRRTDGRALVRRLLQSAMSGDAGPGLIGCDSWAWACLQHLWVGPMPQALTLQAFDGPSLERWFSSLAVPASAATSALRFRNARTGKTVLSLARDAGAESDAKAVADTSRHAISEDIERIAVHCRGNPGTARQYWRDSLRDAPEVGVDPAKPPPDVDAEDPAEDEPGSGAFETVWVAASGSTLAMPDSAQQDETLVLHALLLHGGLPADLLSAVLPLAPQQAQALLLRLQAKALASRDEDARWRIAPLAYAAVRDMLGTRGYLIDSF